MNDAHAGIFEGAVADSGDFTSELRILDLRHPAKPCVRHLRLQGPDGNPIARPKALAQVTVAGALADLIFDDAKPNFSLSLT